MRIAAGGGIAACQVFHRASNTLARPFGLLCELRADPNWPEHIHSGLNTKPPCIVRVRGAASGVPPPRCPEDCPLAFRKNPCYVTESRRIACALRQRRTTTIVDSGRSPHALVDRATDPRGTGLVAGGAVDTSGVLVGHCCMHVTQRSPRTRTGLPSACRYALAVPRRTPVSSWMR